MKLLLTALLFVTSSAFADMRLEEEPTNETVQSVAVEKSVTFSYTSHYSAYACSYLKQQAKAFATVLGATDIRIQCQGGLPDMNFMSATIKFKSAVPMKKYTGPVTPDMVYDARWSHINIQGRESCDFNEQLINALVKEFEVENYENSNTCWHTQGKFEHHMHVLK